MRRFGKLAPASLAEHDALERVIQEGMHACMHACMHAGLGLMPGCWDPSHGHACGPGNSDQRIFDNLLVHFLIKRIHACVSINH